jgi:hypothetical protein
VNIPKRACKRLASSGELLLFHAQGRAAPPERVQLRAEGVADGTATGRPRVVAHNPRAPIPNEKVRIVVSIEGEDARRLQRLSAARGEKPTELIAELLREADKPAA